MQQVITGRLNFHQLWENSKKKKTNFLSYLKEISEKNDLMRSNQNWFIREENCAFHFVIVIYIKKYKMLLFSLLNI